MIYLRKGLKIHKLKAEDVDGLPTISYKSEDFIVTESIEKLAKQKVRLNPETPESNSNENRRFRFSGFDDWIYDMDDIVPEKEKAKMGKVHVE